LKKDYIYSPEIKPIKMEKPFLVAIAFILIIILLTSSCSNNDLKNSQKIINASDLAYYVRTSLLMNSWEGNHSLPGKNNS